jgi:hypothetical protein
MLPCHTTGTPAHALLRHRVEFGISRPQWAIVVFEDRAERGLIRLLRPGFRHCYCLLGTDDFWTVCDPLKSIISIQTVYGLSLSEIVSAYRNSGRIAIAGRLKVCPAGWRLFRPMTCVEIVKCLLGLESPGTITPSQLHAMLLSRGFSADTACQEQKA